MSALLSRQTSGRGSDGYIAAEAVSPRAWRPGAGLRCGAAAGEAVGVGQGPLVDLVGLGGRDADHAEQGLRALLGGLRVVAVRLVVQQLAEAQLGACRDRQG
jgi:hypothetical protein